VEHAPIPDVRTVAAALVAQPSAELLDTIRTCQQRQESYRDFLRTERDSAPLPFVGSATVTTDVVASETSQAAEYRLLGAADHDNAPSEGA
jgi:hypothetical protein